MPRVSSVDAEPETPPAPAPIMALTPEQFQALLEAAKSGGAGESFNAQDLGKAIAQANQRENVAAPMVSDYNPKGDRDHPKAKFTARRMVQNGIRLTPDSLTVEEIEALNALPKGNWRVTKANGVTTSFVVTVEYEPDGVTEELKSVSYPCRSEEDRYDHRSLFDYALDVLEQAGLTTERERLIALRKEYQGLRAALRQ